MSPLAIAIITALAQLGPGAIQALIAIVNAAHDKPLSEADHANLGKLIADAVRSKV